MFLCLSRYLSNLKVQRCCSLLVCEIVQSTPPPPRGDAIPFFNGPVVKTLFILLAASRRFRIQPASSAITITAAFLRAERDENRIYIESRGRCTCSAHHPAPERINSVGVCAWCVRTKGVSKIKTEVITGARVHRYALWIRVINYENCMCACVRESAFFFFLLLVEARIKGAGPLFSPPVRLNWFWRPPAKEGGKNPDSISCNIAGAIRSGILLDLIEILLISKLYWWKPNFSRYLWNWI